MATSWKVVCPVECGPYTTTPEWTKCMKTDKSVST